MYTYQIDPHRPGGFVTNDSYLFDSEAAAAGYCKNWNEHWTAMKPLETVGYGLSRADYEAACARLGIEAMPDRECDSYGVKYGEFEPRWEKGRPGGYSNEYCLKMALAGRRLGGITAERKSAPPRPRPQPDYPNGRKLACGCTVYNAVEVMNASMGTSCFECYDRMSD